MGSRRPGSDATVDRGLEAASPVFQSARFNHRDARDRASSDRLTEQARLLDLSNDAILVRDAEDRITYWSQGAEVEYGFTTSEALGKISHELLKTEFPIPLQTINQILDRTGGWGGEVVQIRKDGSKGTFLARWLLDRDSAGRRRSVLACNTNISDRKRVEVRLRESEERFRALIQATTEVVYRMSPDWNVMQQLEGRNFINDTLEPDHAWLQKYIPAQDQALVLETIRRAIQSKSIFELEHHVFRVDGSIGWTQSRAIPIMNERHEVIEWFGAASDITARKQAEETLRQSEAHLRAVLETAVDAVITIDGRGRMLSVNPVTSRMFGYSAEEMIGRNVNMLMPAPFMAEHDGYLQRYKDTGEKRIIGIGREVQARRKDGTVFPVDLGVSEVEPRTLFTGIIRDISERKASEARLREADRMASIGSLAAGLGHDMNNVLLPVRAHLNALKAHGGNAQYNRSHVQKIEQGITYLQQLADGLHFLAMDPDQEDDAGGLTDLHKWWEQTGALLRKAVPKHVRVSVSIPNDLPKAAVAAHALTQAVLNLIVNAGEAIPAQRKRRQGIVRVVAQPLLDQGVIKLSVSDNGTGMTDEVKRRAFDMFFTTKPRGLGTGLGLAMVQKIADRADGSVEIESTQGKGTTISLLLPTAEEPDAEHAITAYVNVRDGRAASFLRNLVQACGAQISDASNLHSTHIVIVDPTASNLGSCRTWRVAQPTGSLLLFGAPDADADAWQELQPRTIANVEDVEGLRTCLSAAMFEQMSQGAKHA